MSSRDQAEALARERGKKAEREALENRRFFCSFCGREVYLTWSQYKNALEKISSLCKNMKMLVENE